MDIDIMCGPATWAETAALATQAERAGFSGLVMTETSQAPWMCLTAAAQAAPSLHLSTGIAVAFPRSPMVSAAIGWELAENTGGQFRLGLGSQVKAHVERRYGADFDQPAARLRDHVLAVKACFRAFAGDEKLAHSGDFHELSLLPAAWAPRRHEHGAPPVDISAVGPVMCRTAGEVADGIHVHPFHSTEYLNNRLKPAVAEGAARAGRSSDDIDLIIPVFAVGGDSAAERAPMIEAARTQIGFYGSTRNYAFQFDDLGFEGTSAKLNGCLKAGDFAGLAATITDEMLDHFAVIAPWDELADRLVDRYQGVASRLVTYLTETHTAADPTAWDRWAEIAAAVRAA